MRKKLTIFIMLFSGFFAIHAAEITQVRLSSSEEKTRLVFDLSNNIQYKVFSLTDPQRLVIDISHSQLADTLNADALIAADRLSDTPIDVVRARKRGDNDLRIVLELERAVTPNLFILAEENDKPRRLVVDLTTGGMTVNQLRDVIVFIDPGHGGKDPGAIGQNGSYEKTVVLAIAKRLKNLLDRQSGIKAVLSRSDDNFIELNERVRLAEKANADVFIAIHADAASGSRTVQGGSIYVLSERGAAGNKNTQQKNINPALTLANRGLTELNKVTQLHKSVPVRAGFAVLKSSQMPSILVETGFISTPAEERKLNNATHQQALARAIRTATRCYFIDNPPTNTWLEWRKKPTQYVVKSGDTLSEIALAYQISTSRLRRANDLTGDVILIDQVLQIPPMIGC